MLPGAGLLDSGHSTCEVNLEPRLDLFQHFLLENTPGDACQASVPTRRVETIIYPGSHFNVIIGNKHVEGNPSSGLWVTKWIT